MARQQHQLEPDLDPHFSTQLVPEMLAFLHAFSFGTFIKTSHADILAHAAALSWFRWISMLVIVHNQVSATRIVIFFGKREEKLILSCRRQGLWILLV